ncbi:hypothetical protein EJ07DRAFT_158483 [Lizonia empirigonia]|nr:hypothetical protein EJ07DRAFT_158483 [Lizonia empirigonia]
MAHTMTAYSRKTPCASGPTIMSCVMGAQRQAAVIERWYSWPRIGFDLQRKARAYRECELCLSPVFAQNFDTSSHSQLKYLLQNHSEKSTHFYYVDKFQPPAFNFEMRVLGLYRDEEEDLVDYDDSDIETETRNDITSSAGEVSGELDLDIYSNYTPKPGSPAEKGAGGDQNQEAQKQPVELSKGLGTSITPATKTLQAATLIKSLQNLLADSAFQTSLNLKVPDGPAEEPSEPATESKQTGKADTIADPLLAAKTRPDRDVSKVPRASAEVPAAPQKLQAEGRKGGRDTDDEYKERNKAPRVEKRQGHRQHRGSRSDLHEPLSSSNPKQTHRYSDQTCRVY